MDRVSRGAARGVRVHWRHHPSHRNVVGGAGGAPGVAFCDAPRTLSQTPSLGVARFRPFSRQVMLKKRLNQSSKLVITQGRNHQKSALQMPVTVHRIRKF